VKSAGLLERGEMAAFVEFIPIKTRFGHSASAQAFGGQKISCGKTDAAIGSSIRPPDRPTRPARLFSQ